MAKAPWEEDGKRYVAGLQNATDPSCYNDIFESDTFTEAKQKADEAAEKHQRNAIVFDRKNPCDNWYKKVIEKKEDKPPVAVKPPPQKSRRGRKAKSEEPKPKKDPKDDYFD
jgi:hypothetical protein